MNRHVRISVGTLLASLTMAAAQSLPASAAGTPTPPPSRPMVAPDSPGEVVATEDLDPAAFAPGRPRVATRAAAAATAWHQDAQLQKVAGATLKAYTAIQERSQNNGCGQFKTSATITAKPSWIKDTVNWTAYGIVPSATIGGAGVNVSANGSSHPSIYLLNNKGQMGAYLDGSVCMGKLTVYLGQAVAATTLYKGNVGTSNTQV